MSKLTLYQAAALTTVTNYIDTETGEIDTDGLENANIVFNDKVLAVAAYIKNAGLEVDALATVIKDLTEKRRVLENKQASLKTYLSEILSVTNSDKISNSTLSVSLLIGRDTSVTIEDGAVIPLYLCNDPKPPEPSKTKLRDALEAGLQIDGVRIVKKDRLVIK